MDSLRSLISSSGCLKRGRTESLTSEPAKIAKIALAEVPGAPILSLDDKDLTHISDFFNVRENLKIVALISRKFNQLVSDLCEVKYEALDNKPFFLDSSASYYRKELELR